MPGDGKNLSWQRRETIRNRTLYDYEVVETLPPVPVGRYLYQLVMVRGPLIGDNGERLLWEADHVRRRLVFDAAVPMPQRAQVIAVAVSMAWRRVVVPIERPSANEWIA